MFYLMILIYMVPNVKCLFENYSDAEVLDDTCYWSKYECFIFCDESQSSSVSGNVDDLLEENLEDCKVLALKLNKIQFKNNIMSADWYRGLHLIRKLEVTNLEVDTIEHNAFHSFKSVRLLLLENISLVHVKTGAFNGMLSLMSLRLKSMHIKHFEPRILAPCENLQYLTITNMKDTPLVVDLLTGSGNMTHLEEVFIYDNEIFDTITAKTFTGLKVVSSLHLPKNQIISLPNDAFKSISNTIVYLNLEGNKLKVLSANIFFSVLDGDEKYKKILLAKNPWHCDCKLIPLKYLMTTNRLIFDDNATCYTPLVWRNKPIKTAEFCIHSTNPPTQVVPQVERIWLKCRQDDSIVSIVNRSMERIRINKGLYNKITILIEKFLPESVLIVLQNVDLKALQMLACYPLFANRNNAKSSARMFSIDIDQQLDSQKTYLVCTMNSKATTITPLNCVTFHTFDEEINEDFGLWLLQKHMFMAILLFLVVCFAIFLFGILLVYAVSKKYPLLFIKPPLFLLTNDRCNIQSDERINGFNERQKSKDCCQDRASSQAETNSQNSNNHNTSNASNQFDYVYGKVRGNCQISSGLAMIPEASVIPPPIPPFPNRTSVHAEENIYCELE